MSAGAILPILGSLMSDPVFGAIFAEMGTGLVNKFLGLGGGNEPFEQASRQQLEAAQAALPDIRRAAAGLPTASSRAIMRQVQREGTGMQQSLAASARQKGQLGGPAGSTPFRAQSERIMAAQQEGLIQRLGQHQTAAQGQLASMLSPAIGREAGFQQQRLGQKAKVFGTLGRLGRSMQEGDPQAVRLTELLKRIFGGGEPQTNVGLTSVWEGLRTPGTLQPTSSGAQPFIRRPQASAFR